MPITTNDSALTDDGTLARMALGGDKSAFSQLVHRYHRSIYNLAYRLTGDREAAADLTQDALLRSYKALRSYDTARPFAPWLYRIATNLCFDYLEHEKRFDAIPMDELAGEDSEGVALRDVWRAPEAALELAETEVAIANAILELPEKYRAVVILRHINELSYGDIAKVLNLPLGTVKTYLYRGRELLQARLRANGVVP